MSKINRWAGGALIITVFLYAVVGTAWNVFPSLIYKVISVEAYEIRQGQIYSVLTRWSLLAPVDAECEKQLVCNGIAHYPKEDCDVRKTGTAILPKRSSVLESAFNGSDVEECHIQGTITLYPMGRVWGPEIIIPWKSNKFIATRP